MADNRFLSRNGVTALRTFADVLPQQINNLRDANTALTQAFSSVKEQIGPAADDLEATIATIQKFIEDANDDIAQLIQPMRDKADQIENYLNSGSSGSSPL